MKLVTTEEMRVAEQALVDAGDTWEGLMDRAGRAVADEVLARVKAAGGRKSRRVLALVGPGNNGGDALVAGRYLREAGMPVTAYLWNRKPEESDSLAQSFVEQGGAVLRTEDDAELALLARELGRSAVVVDGLLGMGLTRQLEGRLREIVNCVNAAQRPLVIAVDLPTGVHADTGEVLGVAVQSHITVTMSAPKRGLYQFPGAGCAGEVVVAEIGISETMLHNVAVELLDRRRLRLAVPARPRDAHKGTFGRVLVIAGSLNYTGAPYLAAMGAYRVGAGLVTLAPPRTIYPFLAARALETTFLPLPEAETGAIGEGAIKPLAEALGRYQAAVLGCGLGQEEGTMLFVRRFLHMRERVHAGIGFLPREEEEDLSWELPPIVLDADALNALAGVPEWWKSLPVGRAILTPHPGEMARLLGASQEEVLASRIAVAQRAATTWRQIVVFKGAYTVIAHPDGRVAVNPVAAPALATAGTGDVLAGAIAGFLGQGVPPFTAALLGVYVHALAGVITQEEVGDAGAVAGQVLERLPQALRRLQQEGV
jgi:NAD(P)H-hydrate epimerase